MYVNIHMKLEEFLEERKDRFPRVDSSQRDRWIRRVQNAIEAYLDDHDVYYDNMPEDVEELD